MTRRSWILIACLGTVGCVPRLEWKGWPATLPERPAPSAYPRAPAVVLTSETRALLFVEANERPFTEIEYHEVRAVLSEAGIDAASVRIPVRGTARITLLKARTIPPDGPPQEVDAASILEDESRVGPDDDDRIHIKIFRFPNVKVGSLLEYAVIQRGEGVMTSTSGRIAREIPVARYRLEMLFSSGIRYAFHLYNSNAPFRTDRVGSLTRVRLALDNVLARSDDTALPPWQLREPFWIYRAQQYWVGTHIFNATQDWDTALKPRAKRLYLENDRYFAGVKRWTPSADCRDARCRIEQALARAREKVEFSGFDNHWNPRAIKDVLAAGTGNDDEKALYLYRLLEDAGVEARFGWDNPTLGRVVDKTFPAAVLLDHLVLFLPRQPGLDAPLWIDPACEYCAVGEVPDWLAGDEALVFWLERHNLGADVYRTEFKTVEAPTPGRAGASWRYDAVLSSTGDLDVTATGESVGRAAMQGRLETRSWEPAKWLESAQRFVARRAGTGRLLEQSPGRADRAAGRFRRTLRFLLPAQATRDGAGAGERLLLPLSLFVSKHDDDLPRPERTEPVFVEAPEFFDETAVITLPAGFEVAELPAAVHLASPAHRFDFEASAAGAVVTVRRHLEAKPGMQPASGFGAIRDVVHAFAAAPKKVIVLRRRPAARTVLTGAPARP